LRINFYPKFLEFREQSDEKSHVVGQEVSREFGLYDIGISQSPDCFSRSKNRDRNDRLISKWLQQWFDDM